MNFKYILGYLISAPLLPLLYLQGKKLRRSIPKLPYAEGDSGVFLAEDQSSDQPLKILAIGESTIAGIGVETHEEGFAGTLGKELSILFQRDVHWKVYARGGYAVQQITQQIIPKITESNADILIIGIGGNDAFKLSSPEKWRQDVTHLIDSLRTKFPNTTIMFCNMPPIKEFPAFTSLMKFVIGNRVEILGEELDILVKNYKNVYYQNEKIVLDEWMQKLNKKASDFFSDGVHPSKLTYQEWAKEMAVGIKKINFSG
ncbi:MAG: SGNH/GDSL hydrolase family protein [Chitinophagales bacterium]|nr:SGNH/GDSL hydrolase family protein [Chitinophagales bacterium]